MLVKELFKNLIVGELSSLTIGSDAVDNTLDDKYFPKLIAYTNAGLAALHRAFPLKEKLLIIECQDWRTNYPLRAEWAVSNPNPPATPYIVDIAYDTFENDVYKILAVRDMNGSHYAINDSGNAYSLYTPQPDTLKVPNPITGLALYITYQAGHPKLSDKTDSEEILISTLNQVIDLPVYLEPALQAFVASETYAHITGEGNVLMSQKFEGTYNRIIAEVKEYDLVSETRHTTISKLENRGFV